MALRDSESDVETVSNAAVPTPGEWAGVTFSNAVTLTSLPSIGCYATGWQNGLDRLPVEHAPPVATEELAVQVVPIRLQSRLPKTVGFEFPESASLLPALEPPAAKKATPPTDGESADAESVGAKPPKKKQTRIKPPADLVKLEDRLYFVLQPPLETLVASSKLEFPFPPFPYQMDGVAFLFPRELAILADEMGLGKTMQAITAIRMLLLARQLRNVLLICPKPLVSNWVREFSTWAPEIPVTVIEGDSNKRNWIWKQHNAPVRIANYELLMRDQHILDDPDTQFDLVMLDEAQRIKNKNSTTAQIVRALPRTRSWALTATTCT